MAASCRRRGIAPSRANRRRARNIAGVDTTAAPHLGPSKRTLNNPVTGNQATVCLVSWHLRPIHLNVSTLYTLYVCEEPIFDLYFLPLSFSPSSHLVARGAVAAVHFQRRDLTGCRCDADVDLPCTIRFQQVGSPAKLDSSSAVPGPYRPTGNECRRYRWSRA